MSDLIKIHPNKEKINTKKKKLNLKIRKCHPTQSMKRRARRVVLYQGDGEKEKEESLFKGRAAVFGR